MGGRQGGGKEKKAGGQEADTEEEDAWPAAEERAFRRAIADRFEREGCPYYASARLWDDGCIAPEDTRRAVGMALAAALQGRGGGGSGGGGGVVAGGWALGERNTSYGVFRM